MITIVCFIIALHFTTAHSTNVYDAQHCGRSQIPGLNGNDYSNDENDFMQQKVMGGRRAEQGEIPWAVFLNFPSRPSFCGGTLVSRRHVITAAHCFQAKKTEVGHCSTTDKFNVTTVIRDTEVYIGGTCALVGKFGCTKSDIGRMYKVARAFYDDYFVFGCKVTHDIAILELAENVTKTINHVCLPFMHNLEEIEDPYLKLSSFGWGSNPLKHMGFSPRLQIADLGTKLQKEVCDRKKYFKADDTFCTTSSELVCPGDSGGGLTAQIEGRSYLMGIVSHGPNCSSIAENTYGHVPVEFHTDIMYYEKMIKKWIQKSQRETSDMQSNVMATGCC